MRLVLGLVAGLAVSTAVMAGDPPVIVNANTGLALSGFDPVSYFADGKPMFGRPELELRNNGAIWRFRNEGDRAAFADHPEAYTPAFDGYDPVAVAHGKSVAGHPLFWTVSGERLYLFYSEEARSEFLGDPGGVIARANRKWPEVARGIAR
jgi:hypothetical protein